MPDLNDTRCLDCGLFMPCHCKSDKIDFYGPVHDEVKEEPVVILHKRKRRTKPGKNVWSCVHYCCKTKIVTSCSCARACSMQVRHKDVRMRAHILQLANYQLTCKAFTKKLNVFCKIFVDMEVV